MSELPLHDRPLHRLPLLSSVGACVAEIAAGAWGPPWLLFPMTPSPGSTQTAQSTIKSLSVATNSIQPIGLVLC